VNTWSWYKIINLDIFEATTLPSIEATVNFEGIGLKKVLILQGAYVSLLYEGIFLSIAMNDANPFVFEGHAAYLDENNDIWLGIEDEN